MDESSHKKKTLHDAVKEAGSHQRVQVNFVGLPAGPAGSWAGCCRPSDPKCTRPGSCAVNEAGQEKRRESKRFVAVRREPSRAGIGPFASIRKLLSMIMCTSCNGVYTSILNSPSFYPQKQGEQ